MSSLPKKQSAQPTLQVLNLAATEIPQPWTDIARAKRTKTKHIPFGDDNLFPQETAELFRESSTLHSVLTSKSAYFAGQGIVPESGEMYVNRKGLTQGEIYRNLALDYYLTGNAYVWIHRVGDTTNIYNLDSCKVRAHADLDKYLVSSNWAFYNRKEHKPEEIAEYPNFSPAIMGKKGEMSLLRIKDYEPCFDYYGLPNWLGAIFYAKLESLIGRFNVNHFDNGLFSSGILNLPTDGISDEQAEKMVREIKRRLTGVESGNNGKILVFTGGENAPTFTEVDREFEGSFIDLKQLCEDTIVSAAGWKRSLAGLQTEGALGNNQQILNEYQVAMRDIERDRSQILPAIDRVASELNVWGDYEIIDEPPISQPAQALNGAQVQSMVTVAAAVGEGSLTVDAAREIFRIAYNLTEEEADNIVNTLG